MVKMDLAVVQGCLKVKIVCVCERVTLHMTQFQSSLAQRAAL